MRSIVGSSLRRRLGCRVVAGVLVVLGSGCQLMTNTFRDDYSGSPPVTTASVDGVHEAGAAPELQDRGFHSVQAGLADGSVTHGPLLFEDAFGNPWSEDDAFAVTDGELIHWLAWRGRFAVNLVFAGGSMLVTPPWMVMVSDGHPSRSMIGETYDAADR